MTLDRARSGARCDDTLRTGQLIWNFEAFGVSDQMCRLDFLDRDGRDEPTTLRGSAFGWNLALDGASLRYVTQAYRVLSLA